MIILIDNYDSFTYNLVDYFRRLGAEVVVYRNKVPLNEIPFHKASGIVLSPGPETPQKAGNMMRIIEENIGKIPILGICLGHQAIGMHLGAELVLADQPMHGKISLITHNSKGIFENIPDPFEAVRYHSLIINNPGSFITTAHTNTGECMGLWHEDLNAWGVQFHPEAALSKFGIPLLDNWLKKFVMSKEVL